MAVDIKLNGENRYGVSNLYAEKISGGNQKFELPKVLQNKSVTITQNKTVTYTADSGYDGLESLEVTTNVSGGGGSSNPYEDVIDNQISANKGSFLFSYCQDTDQQFANHFTQVVANKMAKINGMFQGCKNLTTLDLSIIPTLSGSQSIAYIFKECSGLTSITNWGTLTTSNLRSAREMFYGCSGFTSLDLSNLKFGTSNHTADYMFYNCTNLQTITLPTSFIRYNCQNMFYGCRALTTINANTFKVMGTEIRGMFMTCTNLATINYNATKQDYKVNISVYATLFDSNNLTQSTIIVQCTDGQLVYNNNGDATFSITENSTTV